MTNFVYCFRLITSLYLPCVENKYNAYDIASVFDYSGIAQIGIVSIERNGFYNRVYLGVECWHDTEIAYNFIMRLKNPSIEAKIIHNVEAELWWVVRVNKFEHKLSGAGRQKRSITTFTPVFNTSAYEVPDHERGDDSTIGSSVMDDDYFTEEDGRERNFKPLERKSVSLDTIDIYICRLVFGRELTFDFQPKYNEFLKQKHAWVDNVLENIR